MPLISVSPFNIEVETIATSPYPGSIVWFDGQDTSTMFQDAEGVFQCDGDLQHLARWEDKSGNGYHATKVSLGNDRPTFRAASFNGHPCAEFNGAQNDSLYNAVGSVGTPGGGHTIFVALNDTTGAGSGTLFQLRRSPATFTTMLFTYNYNTYVYTDSSVETNNATASLSPGDLSVPRVVAFCSTGAGNPIRMFFDNGERLVGHGGGSVSAETGTAGFTIGNRNDGWTGQGWVGLIGEILVYDTALSDSARITTMNYLINKWL